MSEKIETDAIERLLSWKHPPRHQGIVTAAQAQLAALVARLAWTEQALLDQNAEHTGEVKAMSALLRSYRAACGEHASTMVLVHRDEIDGVLG